MDLYPKDHVTLLKLLTKRQIPCTQVFKCQLLFDTTNHPETTQNLTESAPPTLKKTIGSYNSINFINKPKFSSKNLLQGQSVHKFSVNVKRAMNFNTCDDELDHLEKLEKKVKTTMIITKNEKTLRRPSFDAESDHSTACEMRSEGTPMHEYADLMESPLLSALSPKDPAGLKLEEDGMPLISRNSSQTVISDDDVSPFSKAQNQAEKLGGSCLSFEFLPTGKLKFKCKLRHRWEMTLEELDQRWCPKCENLLNQYRNFACMNGGVCLNEKLDHMINFSCSKGHQWSVNHKNFNGKWCQDCIEDEKNFLRKKCEEERRRREKMEEECQKKLFEDAKRRCLGETSHQSGASPEEVLEYFTKVDTELNALAREEAKKFMAQKEDCVHINFEQALQVTKILIMPEDILEKYMMSLCPEILRSEYRRMARITHPDKNKHPGAKKAFQKVQKVYEKVVSTFEGSCKI